MRGGSAPSTFFGWKSLWIFGMIFCAFLIPQTNEVDLNQYREPTTEVKEFLASKLKENTWRLYGEQLDRFFERSRLGRAWQALTGR